MIEVYQIVRVARTFRCTNGFTKERLIRCFRNFEDSIDLDDSVCTSWIFLSEQSAKDYCERHNSSLERIFDCVGFDVVTFEYNEAVLNTVYD